MSDDREKFLYAKIGLGILAHKTTAKLLSRKGGEGAFAVYVAAIIWCRDQMSDGVICEDIAKSLLFGAGARHFERLVEVGWFIARPDGDYDVWNYAKYNETRAQVTERRSKARDRVRSHRSEKRVGNALHERYSTVGNGDVPAYASASDQRDQDPGREGEVQEGVPEAPSATRLRAALADPMGDYELAEHWARGVTDGAGAKMGIPRRGELVALLDVVADHAPPRNAPSGLAAVCAWAYARGKAYGAASRDRERNVFKFRDFVNSPGARAGPRRAADIKQPAAEGAAWMADDWDGGTGELAARLAGKDSR